LSLLIDTGAAWTWVEVAEGKKGKDMYHPTESKSYKESPKPFEIQNGNVKSKARKVTDDVCFANGKLAISNFPFLAVTKKQAGTNASSAGMLGLGITGGDKTAPHFIDYLHKQGHITKRSFSLAFNRTAHPKNKNNGNITFGGLSAGMKKVGMNCHKVVAPINAWTIPFNGMHYNGKVIEIVPKIISKALVDSGSTLTQMPAVLYQKLINEICAGDKCVNKGGVVYIKDCEKDLAGFKPVTFNIETKSYKMAPQSFVQYYLNENGEKMCEISFRPIASSEA